MIASLGNSYVASTVNRSSGKSAKALAFGSVMESASSSTSATPQVSISSAARLANASAASTVPTIDESFYKADAARTPDERKAYYGKLADQISASQGLPSGEYNFHDMSSSEAYVVTTNMKLDGTSSDSLDGISEMINIYTSTDPVTGYGVLDSQKHDFIAAMEGQRDYEAGGNSAGAAMMQSSFGALAKVQGDVTQSASDASSSAVDELTKTLTAFKKEAALTPAQRARRDVLKTMKLTEDAITTMPPEQQKATEQKIATEVARRLRLGEGGKDQKASVSTDTAAADPLTLSV